ncbi:MAG TPA: amino acid adenylation domain-containing protein [Pyrinomonadaceae bacterium]|jgi:amino acid adenylation domain-containing protein/non-ribosomal peptide synthase protein (TIGR01720 family)
MSDFSERIKALSPERRALLGTLLLERSKGGARRPTVPRRPEGEVPPLSFAQERLWFLHQLEPESTIYNVHAAVRLSGALDAAALGRTIDEIVRRHEAVRTTFGTVGGETVQVIAPELDLGLPVLDLSGLGPAEREAEVRRLGRAEALRPFDLTRGPLMRTTLLRLREEDHVFLLTMHHIVSDAWSMGVLIREVAALYAAFAAGRPSPLAELPIQYADFALWQRQHLTGEVLASQLEYWKGRLAGAPPSLQLPVANPRPPVQSFSGATYDFTLPEELAEGLKELSRREGVTLFMTLLAAFQTLLYRYTGEPDVVVGSPIANRTLHETEGLIGFFANTLVLRTDLSGEPSFRELLGRVREVALGAYAHQDLPFEKLVEELQPERSLSYGPLFQVVFVLQNTPQEELELPGLRLTQVPVQGETAKFDITLSMTETKRGLRGELEFNTDLFTRESARQLLDHFVVLLRRVVEEPGRPVSMLPLLDGGERRRLVDSLNDTAAEFSRDRCLHQLFAEQAGRTPDAVALICEGGRVSYRELNERAARLARHLRGRGVGPEVRVGILMERSLEMVVAVLGVLKAGGAYVPLDPNYPADRVKMMAEDAGLGAVVSRRGEAQRLALSGPWETVLLDEERARIEAQSAEELAEGMSSLGAAYVIYTSGSTGRPKGVVGLHRGAVNRFEWMWRTYPFAAGEVCCQKTSLNFLDSLWEIFGPLLRGVPVVVIPDEKVKDPARLVEVLADNRVTRIVLVPSLLRVILDSDTELQRRLPDLKWWVTSGEALPVELYERFRAALPAAVLLNLYGSSEMSADATWYDTSGGITSASVPIGRPLSNTQVYLLDRHLQPVPPGVPGEIYVGGEGLARGYHHLPAMTAERFIPHPFAREAGARLYRPGDLGRHLPDGNIEYLGRLDSQAKVRGFRVELGEIETHLEAHPGVRRALVVAREDRPGDKRLVAYTVADGGEAPKVSELRDFLKQKLPDYMVPAAFVALPELPLTPSGKVDRTALPAPDGARPELEGSYAAPRDETERVLAETWARVLGLERVGIHDNFFELGGDSILSIQAVARGAEAGLGFTPKQLFQHQTVAGLARVVTRAAPVTAAQEPVTGEVPLTPIQHWFFELPLPEPHHFNQTVTLEAPGDVDATALRGALAALLRHHDALRMRFTRRPEGGWRQFNEAPGGAVPFSLVDVSAQGQAEQLAAIEAEGQRLHASLDLSAGPLLRAALFRTGGDRPSRLLITIHHLVVDGVSWRILLSDLEAAYAQLRRGADAPRLAAKTTSFRRWAAGLEEYARSARVRQELAYWAREVRPSGALPRDKAGENTVSSSRLLTTALTAEETRRLLHEAPKAYQTQINDLLLTALAKALTEATGSPRVLLDLEGHGREEEVFDGVNLSRTVGWFTTIFPVLLEPGGASGGRWDCGEALKSVKEQLRRVPHRGLGYGVLRYLSRDAEAAARLTSQPQAECSFNYLGQFDAVLSGSSLFRLLPEASGGAASKRGPRRYVLEVIGRVSGERLHLDWIYSEQLHHRRTVERLAESFNAALRALLEHCLSPEAGGCTPSDFPDAFLDQEELDGFLSKIASKL